MTDQQSRPLIFLDSFKANFPTAILYVASTGSLLLGIGAQLFSFAVLARYLGAAQFGNLMAITAATSIALSVCGVGTEEVMTRRCVREPSLYPQLLGHSLILILIPGLVLSILVVISLNLLMGLSADSLRNVESLSIFAISNIVLARWIVLTEAIFIAHHRMMYANIVVAGFALARAVTAVIGCVIFGVHRLETWAVWHGGIHVVGAVACIIAVGWYGAPKWCLLRDEIWRGIHGSTMQLINNLSQNIDRLVLTAIVPAATVGAYGVSSSIVRYSFVTLLSFSRIFYPKLAVAGGLNGASGTFRLAIKYLPIVVGLAALNTLGLLVIAPFLPWLFGAEFGHSTHYLIMLCGLPFLVAIQNSAYDALGAAEKHGLRALFYNSFGVIGAGLIVGLTYLYGVNGAVAALYISLAVLCIAMWSVLIVVSQRD